MFYIDNRWTGNYGIARFATEVLSRLQLNALPLPVAGRPTSKADVLSLRRLRLNTQDVIYTPGFNVGFTRAKQVPTVHDLIHLDQADESSTLKRAYYNRILRPAILQSGLVLTVSNYSRDRLVDWLGDATVTVTNVGNGLSTAFATPRPPRARSDDTLLFIGDDRPHKNLPLALQLLAARPRLKLVVVTTAGGRVMKLAEHYRVESRVSIRSNQTDSELAGLYSQALALLFPTTLEGFGLPAIEAAAVGTPVLYWKGCKVVDEVMASSESLAVPSVTGVDEWITRVDRVQSAANGRTTDWIIEHHDWQKVALQVQRALSPYVGLEATP